MINGRQIPLNTGSFSSVLKHTLPSPNTQSNRLTLVAEIIDAYEGTTVVTTEVTVVNATQADVGETIDVLLGDLFDDDPPLDGDGSSILTSLVTTTSQLQALGGIIFFPSFYFIFIYAEGEEKRRKSARGRNVYKRCGSARTRRKRLCLLSFMRICSCYLGSLTPNQTEKILSIAEDYAFLIKDSQTVIQLSHLLSSVASISPYAVANTVFIDTLTSVASSSKNSNESRQVQKKKKKKIK